jgi:hypothetical protein
VAVKIEESLNKAFLAAIMVLVMYFATTLNVGYYTKADLLGPITKFPIVFGVFGMAIALAMTHAFRHRPWRGTAAGYLLLASPVILLVLYLLFFPDAIEKYMLTNHYDVPEHMARAMYLADTGKININIDSYFDLQPGVFCSTAIFMITTGIDPYAIFKWFPLFFVIIAYLPALVFFGRSFFEDPGDLAIFVFLAIIITWPPTRYHYSGQVYLMPIFMIVAGLLTKTQGKFNRRQLIVLILAFLAIIVTHQGVALFTVAMLAGMFLYSTFRKQKPSRAEMPLLFITLLFLVMWFVYLNWLTIYAFGDWVQTLQHVANIIISEPFWLIFAGAIARPDPTYQLLVYGKVVFTAITYLSGLFILAYLWLRKSSGRHGALLSITIPVSAVIYLLGFAAGGVGFVERAVLMTAPFIAIGLAVLMSKVGGIKSPWPTAILLILLMLTGTVLFNSSRNFQSRLGSEQTCDEFVSLHDPAQIPIYHSITVTVPRYSYKNVGEVGKVPVGIFMILPSYVIESSYWVPNVTLSDALAAPIEKPSAIRFYSSGICVMYLVTEPIY